MSSLMFFVLVLVALVILITRDMIDDQDVNLELRAIHWGCWLIFFAAVFPQYALFLLVVTGLLFIVVGFEEFPKMFWIGIIFIGVSFIYKTRLS